MWRRRKKRGGETFATGKLDHVIRCMAEQRMRTAYQDHGRVAGLTEFGRFDNALTKLVAAQDHNGICFLRRITLDKELTRCRQNWYANQVKRKDDRENR